MSKFYFDIEQGTDEWRELRAGKITASVAKTFLVKGKLEGGFGTGAITELYRMLEERLTGVPRESFGGNKATDWGHTYEDEAAEYYEMKNFILTSKIGFIEKDKFIGASPDRVMPKIKKGLEIKCFPKEHMRIADTKEYGKGEYIQCQFNLWVSGYESWDLVYYHPNLPEKSKLIEFNFKPDKEMFEIFKEKTELFKKLINLKTKQNG